MILHSFAKINLALLVKNKRPDNFHNIATIFTTVDLHDTLVLQKSAELTVKTNNPAVPSGPDNLVYKAARLLQQAYGLNSGASILIKKKIPMGAGLAGGSGNAAAAIKGLLKLWRLKSDKRKIDRILKKVGSDVPYCYYGGTRLGRGRGEKLKPLPDFTGYTIVLVCPGVSVSTPWAYKKLKRNLTFMEDKVNLYLKYRFVLSGKRPLSALLVNDFEGPVFEKYPVLRKIKRDLLGLKAEGALMSGSGSTLMGFFKSEANARIAASVFRQQGMKAFVVKPKAC